jgi:hypothetical protein
MEFQMVYFQSDRLLLTYLYSQPDEHVIENVSVNDAHQMAVPMGLLVHGLIVMFLTNGRSSGAIL